MKTADFFRCTLMFLFFVNTSVAQETSLSNAKTSDSSREIETLKKSLVSFTLSEGEEGLIQQLTKLPKEINVADQVVNELMQHYPKTEAEFYLLLDKLQLEGNWSDIHYDDQKKGGWEPNIHVGRILELTQAYAQPSSQLYHSQEVANAIHKSLQYWFEKQLVCNNWWYNEIGVPKALGVVFILFEDQLSQEEMKSAIAVMSKSSFKMTGQNKVWQAENVLVRALLQNDFELVKQARDTILSEIAVEHSSYSRHEGIRVDYSYHQHGEQQQFGNYGTAFLSTESSWVKVFSRTLLAVDQNKLDILSELINEGFRRILWKGYMDVNCLGRQFFKQAQIHKAFSVVFSAKNLADVDTKNREKYLSLIAENYSLKENDTRWNGLYHFWKSDQTIYRSPNWMTSIRMSSPGTIGSEAGNGDNMKGYYLADGATYVYVDGDEYNNIFPVWDWRKLPGVTSYETDAPMKVLKFGGYWNFNEFVGNVSDGECGLTTFQLQRDGLVASKSWVITKDFIFCIGAGIHSACDSVVTSSIEQRLKKSDLLYLNKRKWVETKKLELKGVSEVRFFQDKTGYIILEADRLNATDETRKGSWHDIMQNYPEDMIAEEPVISLWLDHGKKPQDAAYQYVILPATTAAKTALFDTKSIQVLSNTKEAQVIYLPDEQKIFIAAYSTLSMKLPQNLDFSCEQPGLFLIQYQAKGSKPKVTCSDPTQKLSFLDIEINGEKERINLLNENK